MHAKFLDTLDWGILIAYFLILIAIGIWADVYKRQNVTYARTLPLKII